MGMQEDPNGVQWRGVYETSVHHFLASQYYRAGPNPDPTPQTPKPKPQTLQSKASLTLDGPSCQALLPKLYRVPSWHVRGLAKIRCTFWVVLIVGEAYFGVPHFGKLPYKHICSPGWVKVSTSNYDPCTASIKPPGG